jgi:hypothetical protein
MSIRTQEPHARLRFEPIGDPVPPPLVDGDRLTRAEFHRRYEAMPPHIRAELIEGVVVMASPVRFEQHGWQHIQLATWAGTYEAHTPGVRSGLDSTVRLDLLNEPQPDVVMLIDPTQSGRITFEDGFIAGAPEFVAEIAGSTTIKDLGPKLEAYRRNGIREYLVWRVLDEEIDWFILRNGRYEQLTPDDEGILRSETLPGLWLDGVALQAAELARFHAVMHEGLASEAHAEFVRKLAK